ncbi:MAG TPA: hypothetical protein VKT18_04020, partial [Acidimicrobiales bacterium]|nr:hypothetical protein [Acidimicrobiales bacterium]
MRRYSLAGAAALVIALAPLGSAALASSGVGANGMFVFVRGGTIWFSTGGNTGVTGTDPEFSPDGTKLVYVDGSGKIETCTVAGSCASPSGALQTGVQPAWSPDGTKIAYSTGNGISVMNTAGAVLATLTSTAADAHPTWSPDGTQIAFDRSGSLYTVTYPGGVVSAAITTNNATSDSDPNWSPDGLSLAFQGTTGGHTHILVVSVSGGDATQVTPSSTDDESAPSWSPDGLEIVYADATTGIEQVDSFGFGSPVVIDSNPGDATPDWQTVAPVAVTAPSITGGFSPQTGVALTATTGSWNGAKAGGFSDQWQRCDSGGGQCATIGGATLQSYTPAAADVGHTLRVVVTASNTAGSTPSSPSAATGLVSAFGVAIAPKNSVYPTVTVVSGDPNPAVGDLLTATTGTWVGTFPITYAYQWLRCDPTDTINGSCYSLAGATSSSLTIPPEAWKYRIRVQVTATNGGGSVAQLSLPTVPIRAVAPILTLAPPITGNNVVGQTLSVGTGSWGGAPKPTISYDWRSCDALGTPASCVSIPGATGTTYVPTPNDIGHALRVYLTGTNIVGSATGFTVHTFPIVDRQHFAPSVTTPPTVTGVPVVDGGLVATNGTYAGDTPLGTTLQWQRCDAVGDGCRGIRGAFRLKYTPTAADVGSTIRVVVTAKNGYGTILSMSAVTTPVLALPPHRVGLRIVGRRGMQYLLGTPRDDVIVAGPGNVTIDGDGGNDTVYAGSGHDVIIIRGPGTAHVHGGTGSATIEVANGYRDYVTCTGTHDHVVADPFDVVKN